MAEGKPDNTAVRTALWRALHLEVDAPPHVLADRVGLQLAAPEDGWRDRPDMDPRVTAGFRASIVARARYIEDVVAEAAKAGEVQYVILGAGLDTFAQRRMDLAGRVRVFEVDQPGISQRGAAAAGTPFRSFFTPDEIVALALEAGFADVRHVCSADQNARYFAGRPDGLHLPTGEDLLVATT